MQTFAKTTKAVIQKAPLWDCYIACPHSQEPPVPHWLVTVYFPVPPDWNMVDMGFVFDGIWLHWQYKPSADGEK